MTKPSSESQAKIAWVNKIRSWGFVVEENQSA
jgi:hypothetical protein